MSLGTFEQWICSSPRWTRLFAPISMKIVVAFERRRISVVFIMCMEGYQVFTLNTKYKAKPPTMQRLCSSHVQKLWNREWTTLDDSVFTFQPWITSIFESLTFWRISNVVPLKSSTQNIEQMCDKGEHNYVADAQNWEQRVKGEMEATRVSSHDRKLQLWHKS